MKKIVNLLEKYWDIFAYLIFGVLTTVVNYLIYLPCYNLLGLPATVSNGIAWVVSVTFAYLTNKPFVFKSHDWSWKTVGPELDLLGWNGNAWKLITSVLVVVLNYIGSKLLVFRKK